MNNSPKPFSWLPDWLWAYNYPHNVNEAGVAIPGCVGKYCTVLPEAVYPTPLYEIIMCFILFFILWSLRKNRKVPGTLFALYLIVNGIERFLIETIRVNNRLDFFGLHPTQAEVISTCLVIGGIGLWIYLHRKKEAKQLRV